MLVSMLRNTLAIVPHKMLVIPPRIPLATLPDDPGESPSIP
jgi:hypothetical protein